MENLKIKYSNSDEIGDTPAAVSSEDKTIYVNPTLFNRYTPFQKCFILLHEAGHYTLDTKDELKADTFAFNHLVGRCKLSLKKSIKAIEETLRDGNCTKAQRLDNIWLQALKWDYEHGNKSVEEELQLALQNFNGNSKMGNFSNKDKYTQAKLFLAQCDEKEREVQPQNHKDVTIRPAVTYNRNHYQVCNPFKDKTVNILYAILILQIITLVVPCKKL